MGKARELNAAVPRVAGEGWSAWQRVEGLPALSAEVLTETLDGGQAFRWVRLGSDTWLGNWSTHVLQLRHNPAGRVEWRAPAPVATSVEAAVSDYLGTTIGFPELTNSLPWRSDPHLARCVAAFPGLRLLRQPFGETLLCFLCSATKQIVQIKQMVGLLATRHGRRLPVPASVAAELPTAALHALPTWDVLATVSEVELRECLLGFRARYISETARVIARQPGWLEATAALPYLQAKERLCSLPGVGEKVADCVLLFGAGKLEAFPVDVWILKTLARRYALEGWKTPQLAHFGRVHFGPLAGLAQQFLFAWERREARASRLVEKGLKD